MAGKFSPSCDGFGAFLAGVRRAGRLAVAMSVCRSGREEAAVQISMQQ